MPEHEQRQSTDEQFRDATLIWNFHQMGHEQRPCSAAIGLGSHDLGVATAAVDLYRAGLQSPAPPRKRCPYSGPSNW